MKNQTLRLGVFLIVGAILCGIMSYDHYRSRRQTAVHFAQRWDIEFVSVQIPLESKVTGLIGVVLLAAGIKCIFDSRDDGDDHDLGF